MTFKKLPEPLTENKWDIIEAIEKLNDRISAQQEDIEDLIKDREENLKVMDKVNVNMMELLKLIQEGKKI